MNEEHSDSPSSPVVVNPQPVNTQPFFGGRRLPLGVVWFGSFIAVFLLYFSQLFSFFSALPVFYFALVHGFGAGLSLLIPVLAFFFHWNPFDALIFLVGSGGAALVSGSLLWRGRSLPVAIFSGTAATVFLGSALWFAQGVWNLEEKIPNLARAKQEIETNINTFYDRVSQQAQEARDVPLTAPELAEQRQVFRHWALGLLPAGLISLTALSLWIYAILLKPLLRKRGMQRLYEPLSRWRAPDFLVWVPIVMATVLILRWEAFKIPAVNVLVVSATLYLFQGIAVAVFFFKSRQVASGWRLLFYAVTILFWKFVVVVMVTVGFFDLWFNFRKLKVGEG